MNELDDKIYKFVCEGKVYFTSAQTQFDAETNWDFTMSCEHASTKYLVDEVELPSIPEDATWF